MSCKHCNATRAEHDAAMGHAFEREPTEDAKRRARACHMLPVGDYGRLNRLTEEFQDLLDERDRNGRHASIAERLARQERERAEAAEQRVEALEAKCDLLSASLTQADKRLAGLVHEVRAYQTGESKRKLSDILDAYDTESTS